MYQKILHIICFTLLLAACNASATEPAGTPTPDIGVIKTQAVGTVIAAAKTAAVPTITPTVLTPTPTFVKPSIHFAEDTNCRSGPGVRFGLIKNIKAGETAEPVGQPVNGGYWVVKSPGRNEPCWVVAEFATPSGSIDRLPKMTTPPLPTPQPVPEAPTLTGWDFSCVYPFTNSQAGATANVVLKWADPSPFIVGYGIYRNNTLITSPAATINTYTDTFYLSYGESATYYVLAYNYDGSARSKEITISCNK
jgi:hypothetical protein